MTVFVLQPHFTSLVPSNSGRGISLAFCHQLKSNIRVEHWQLALIHGTWQFAVLFRTILDTGGGMEVQVRVVIHHPAVVIRHWWLCCYANIHMSVSGHRQSLWKCSGNNGKRYVRWLFYLLENKMSLILTLTFLVTFCIAKMKIILFFYELM